MESLHSLWECDDVLPDFDDADDHLQPAAAPPALAQPSPPGSLHPGCSFQFMENDLDAAIQSSKNPKKAKKVAKIKRKREKMPDRKKALEMDLKAFIAGTSRFLKEPKRHLIEAAVKRFGIDVLRDLVHEVDTIEKNGGQMIVSGMRRRTPGGVLWNVLRSRYEDDYKAIMEAGRNYEKEQRQHKHKVEVNDMAIDGHPSTKRRRTGATGLGMALQAAQVKRTGVIVWPSKCTQMDDMQSKVDPDNSHALPRVHSAWAEGVKIGKHILEDTKKGKRVTGLNDVKMLDDDMNKKPSIADRIRVPIQYDDL